VAPDQAMILLIRLEVFAFCLGVEGYPLQLRMFVLGDIVLRF
jgi:hypothetical protein